MSAISPGNKGGWYDATFDFCAFAICTKDVNYFRILFHEIAHATGSRKHLNRAFIISHPFEKTAKDYAFEECVADTTSKLFLQYFGLKLDPNDPETITFEHYFDIWANRCERKIDEVKLASEREAKKIFDYILDLLNKTDIVKVKEAA
jgi:antirestriction protein ArdC